MYPIPLAHKRGYTQSYLIREIIALVTHRDFEQTLMLNIRLGKANGIPVADLIMQTQCLKRIPEIICKLQFGNCSKLNNMLFS